MAKNKKTPGVKKKKKGSSGVMGGPARLEMKAKKPKKENPFERRFGREKHQVLNRKSGLGAMGNGIMANSVGKPGQARAKAQEKRKKMLLPEYERRNKSGVLMDRRIGEGNPGMSAQDKIDARMAAMDKRRRKKTLFQLAEDEEETLTHGGRAIADIERFEDPRSDDEDDEADKKLDAKFVGETHFGGFMSQADMEFAAGSTNNRKEWIDKMIADSKARKYEKQKNLEEAETMTKDLDSKWKGMFGQLKMSGHVYTKGEKMEEDKSDSYDVVLRELGFEKGRKEAKDRLKTQEEIILEDKERLEKLEAERLKRMRGEVEDMDEDDEEEADDDGEEDGEDEEEGEEEEASEEDEEEDDDDDGSDLEESDEEEEKTPKKKAKKSKPTKDIGKSLAVKAGDDLPYTFAGTHCN